MNSEAPFRNPFRPGAGHMPPFLAGRDPEISEFQRLLRQDVILENLVLTGLRGVGKTVLLEEFKPVAISGGWVWVGTDLSESTSLNEEHIAIRLLTDLSVVTSSLVLGESEVAQTGFAADAETVTHTLDFKTLLAIFQATPGLVADKLKAILELVWRLLVDTGHKGVVFAYDEAQNLADHAGKDQYPLSLLLDVFLSIQRKDIPFMLALTGLPTLFPKLVKARTCSERMFHVVLLDRLDESSSRDAILKPIEDASCPVRFMEDSVDLIVRESGGYPYFIQFLCREVFDVFVQLLGAGHTPAVPVDEILRKLDSDFFAGRWARATDRQRDLLSVIAQLPDCDGEFTVREVVELSKSVLPKPFSDSHANQMLASLGKHGLVLKNRHGKYMLAAPLMGQFIRRRIRTD